VGIAARKLPIVRSCPVGGVLPNDTGVQATIDCTHCAAPVYDLTRRSEREVRRLLAAHVGRSICVQYRVRPDGDIAVGHVRSGLAAVGVGAWLVACAGHLDELDGEPPVEPCEQRQCYDAWAIPDQVAELGDDAFATDELDAPATGESVDAAARSADGPDAVAADEAVASADRGIAGDAETGPHIVANFAIDPDAGHLRGAIVVELDEWHDGDGRLRWVPTRRLIAQWRERMRERRRGRE
jgi:hypothetical protein